MKKKVILPVTFLIIVISILPAKFTMADDRLPLPVQDNYLIDSLKILPEIAYEGDIIKLAVSTTHTSGGCDLTGYRIWQCGGTIIIDATYEQGMLTYICHSEDTIEISRLPAGTYTLVFDWRETITFNVLPNQQGCRAYFTCYYLKCLDSRCLNAVAFVDSSQGDAVRWKWEFGDSTQSNEKNPVHVYEKPGIYDVCLTISAENGCISSYCEKVPVGPADKCKAYFEMLYPDCYSNDLADCLTGEVAFLDKSTGNIKKWAWDFGDSTSSREQHPVHIYTHEGKYPVCLTIETVNGCIDTYYDTAYIRLPRCKADFSWQPLRCYDAFTRCERAYQFTDGSTGDVEEWYWNFGDGDTSTLQNPIHIYGRDGNYVVSLAIRTSFGCADAKYDTLVAGDPNARCKADLTWEEVYPVNCIDSTNCITPYHFIQFTDKSRGQISDWHWHFGDGDSSSLQDPLHIYAHNGRFVVSLTVTSYTGCSDTEVDTIILGDTLCEDCIASFSWNEVYPNADCTRKSTDCITPYYYIQFTDESAGYVKEWLWNFGDGKTSEEQSPLHEYLFAGTYQVCLTVICNNWCYGWVCKTIAVGDTIPGDCYAGFTVSDLNICEVACPNCSCVQFQDKSSWNAVQWHWDFGDGDTSSLQNPFHIYSVPPGDSVFNVCLAIKTSDNCYDTLCRLYNPLLDSLLSGYHNTIRASEKILVYPNPSDEEIYIDLSGDLATKDFVLVITDMFGRTVDMRKYHAGSVNDRISYNVANLTNGQYICSIIADKKLIKGRFAVNK